jgi:LysM repeat protein
MNLRKKNNEKIIIASLTVAALFFATAGHLGGNVPSYESSAYSGTFIYTVQSGDTLYGIGKEFGVSWQTIAQINGINYPYTIYTGETLEIPINYCGGAWTYTVQSGDTVGRVASWFDVSPIAIEEFNSLKYPYTIYSGEKLLIPNCGNSNSSTYIVQSGDSLFSIGNQYGLPWQALADANILSYPYVIYTGETLLIPSTSPPQDVLAVNDPCSWWWGCQTNKYDSLILEYSNEYSVPDPMIIKAEIALESGYNPNAEAWNNACGSYDMGLMQINPTCNNLNATELFYPWYNVDHASQIWAEIYSSLVSKWGSGCGLETLIKGTLEVYNRGSGAAGSYCGSFPDGTDYANNVIYYYFQFTNDSGYQPKF